LLDDAEGSCLMESNLLTKERRMAMRGESGTALLKGSDMGWRGGMGFFCNCKLANTFFVTTPNWPTPYNNVTKTHW